MLKKIPKILSPELVKTLMEMGHGDEIVIADANFPCHSVSDNVIRADGVSGCDMLRSILELFPLDTYVEYPACYMKVVDGDNFTPRIWSDYERIFEFSDENYKIEYLERFDFYERAKKSYAVIATGETEQYANIILKKGVVRRG